MEAQRTERRLPATLGFTKPPCGHDILQDLHGLWPWQRGMTASCGHVMLRKAGHNMGKITYCFGVIEDNIIPKNFWSGTYRQGNYTETYSRYKSIGSEPMLFQYEATCVYWVSRHVCGQKCVRHMHSTRRPA